MKTYPFEHLPAYQSENRKYGLPEIAGRSRTPYFYKREALAWLAHTRHFEWFKGQRATAKNFALMYFRDWKKMKGIASKIPSLFFVPYGEKTP